VNLANRGLRHLHKIIFPAKNFLPLQNPANLENLNKIMVKIP